MPSAIHRTGLSEPLLYCNEKNCKKTSAGNQVVSLD